jgi:hypothetical protein
MHGDGVALRCGEPFRNDDGRQRLQRQTRKVTTDAQARFPGPIRFENSHPQSFTIGWCRSPRDRPKTLVGIDLFACRCIEGGQLIQAAEPCHATASIC